MTLTNIIYGFDGIVIEGAASKPTWINIVEGDVELVDASNLWGLDTHETQRVIYKTLLDGKGFGEWISYKQGSQTTQRPAVLVIGPAGENKSRIASIQTDAGNSFGQGGFGDGIAVEFDRGGFELNMEEFGFDVSQVDKPPRYLRRVPPVYPFSAKRKGLRGWVMIKCLVDKNGMPTKIAAVKADPPDVLDDFGPICVKAVEKWRFYPGEIGGDPVPTRVAFRVQFELD